MGCYKCACLFCLKNCELPPEYFVRADLPEGSDACFFCDECKNYTGDLHMRSMWRPDCPEQNVSRVHIERLCSAERKKLKLIE